MSNKKPDLYKQVVAVTTDYLGPAAIRFIDRQIENHLRKEPEDLKRSDLKILADWSRLALGLLTEDTRLIDEFTERLVALGKS
jgi:siroheme synthase (precorrin-2 oxidase/ferrochelatase)